MTTSELRDYATMVAASVALLVFIFNVRAQARARRIENLTRFNQAHQRLFAIDAYLALHLTAIERGTMVRDHGNAEMENRFHLMLLEIERLAILGNNNAVPRYTQIYMFGSYARHILKLLSQQERESMFWEVAVRYLEGIARDTEAYATLTRGQRSRYWR